MSDNKGTPPKPQQPKPQPSQQPTPFKRNNEGTVPVHIPIQPPEKKLEK